MTSHGLIKLGVAFGSLIQASMPAAGNRPSPAAQPNPPAAYEPELDTLGHRLLRLEAEAVPVPDAAYRLLDQILIAARARLGGHRAMQESSLHSADDRRGAEMAVREIGKLLHELGFRYRGEVHSLADALATPEPRSKIRKFDCDTGSFIYLSIAEELSLPLTMVEIPGHNIVRWRLADGSDLDWDTNDRKVRRQASGTPGGRAMTTREFTGYFFFLRGVSWQDRGNVARAIEDHERSICAWPRSKWRSPGPRRLWELSPAPSPPTDGSKMRSGLSIGPSSSRRRRSIENV